MKRLIFLTALLIALNTSFGQTPLDTAVNINVKDTEGNTIELFDLLEEDYIVIIDFFRTDCSYCNIYAPDFQASYEDFGCNSSNVYFMSIDYGHTNEQVNDFEEEHNMTLPACSGLDGNGNAAHEAYEITGTPTYVVIAPDHEILEQQIWPPETDALNAALLDAGGNMAPCTTGTPSASSSSESIIYPNPVKEFFTIQQDQVEKKLVRIEIHNIKGKLVRSQKIEPKISCEDLKPDMYFVSIFADDRIIHREKIIIRN
ncbi:MAG: redoxin domain-containing protein [Bacteroidales bacterium]|nr:redoxin domain-containing protein [Bacteroidales bacterium]MCF8338516.1 redoxin domain-containing protein [Bacteroidales bacterium]